MGEPYRRGKVGKCTEHFVEMFANADSLHLAADVRQALSLLCRWSSISALGPPCRHWTLSKEPNRPQPETGRPEPSSGDHSWMKPSVCLP